MNPEGLAEGKPHMIENELFPYLFVIVVNHVGFMSIF